MRKIGAVVLMEVVIGAVGLFIEERFAVPGDVLWAGVAITGMVGIVLLYSPEIIRRVTVSRPENPGDESPPPPYPISTTWISGKEAFEMVRRSTLVNPPPSWSDDLLKPEWRDIQQYKKARASEMASMHLGDFRIEYPDAVREGEDGREYGAQTLAWWIGKKITVEDYEPGSCRER